MSGEGETRGEEGDVAAEEGAGHAVPPGIPALQPPPRPEIPKIPGGQPSPAFVKPEIPIGQPRPAFAKPEIPVGQPPPPVKMEVPIREAPLRCPTCRAPWRGVSPCPRCGTELEPWLEVIRAAWQRREASRQAFLAGDYPRACHEALEAWRLHRTERGRRLLILGLLATGRRRLALALTEGE